MTGYFERDAYFRVDCTKIRQERELVSARVTAREQRWITPERCCGVLFQQALGVGVEV